MTRIIKLGENDSRSDIRFRIFRIEELIPGLNLKNPEKLVSEFQPLIKTHNLENELLKILTTCT